MHTIKKAIAWFCIAVAIFFGAINAFLLARGAQRWGLEIYEKIAYGAVAATIPYVIMIMPFLIVATWKQGKRWGRPSMWTLVGCGLYLVLVVYNLIGASGAISSVREEVVAARAYDATTARNITERRAALNEQLKSLGSPRDAGQLQALVTAEMQAREYGWTNGCTLQGASQKQRAFCTGFEKLKAEMAAAKSRDRLLTELGTLDRQLVTAGPTIEHADPQTEILGLATGWNKRILGYALSASTPIVLELCSMFLLGLGLLLLGGSHSLVQADLGAGAGKPLQEQDAAPALPKARENALLTQQMELARWFFSHCTRPVKAGSLRENDWYAHYRAICDRSNDVPLPVESFRRIAIEKFHIPVAEVDGVYFYREHLPIIPANAA